MTGGFWPGKWESYYLNGLTWPRVQRTQNVAEVKTGRELGVYWDIQVKDDSRLEKGDRIKHVENLGIVEKVWHNFWLIILGVWGKKWRVKNDS